MSSDQLERMKPIIFVSIPFVIFIGMISRCVGRGGDGVRENGSDRIGEEETFEWEREYIFYFIFR